MKKHAISGYILVNKPPQLSSFDVVAHVRRLLSPGAKVGHAGTLDPFAQGILLIGIGREATAHFKELALLDKTYKATGQLGLLTDTLDHTGNKLAHLKSSDCMPYEQCLLDAIVALGSSYYQAPPIFSAIKFKGKRLYVLAREGILNEQELQAITALKKKLVDIFSLRLEAYKAPFFRLEARVSHGTYIRSLVNDIARNAGSCATTIELIRTAVGPLTLEQACALSNLATLEDIQAHLIPTQTLLSSIKEYLQAHYKADLEARLRAHRARLHK